LGMPRVPQARPSDSGHSRHPPATQTGSALTMRPVATPARSTHLFHFPALLARGYKPRQAREALIRASGSLEEAISICEGAAAPAAAAPAAGPPESIAPASRQTAASDQDAQSFVASQSQASSSIRNPSGPPVTLGPAMPQQASETTEITSEGSALHQRLKDRRSKRNKQQEDQAAQTAKQGVKASVPVPVQEKQGIGHQSADVAELSKLGEQLLFATPEEVPAILSKLESWDMKVEQLVETKMGKIVRECCRAHGSHIRAQGDQLLQRWLQVYRSERAPSVSLNGSNSSPDRVGGVREAVTGSASSPESATSQCRESSKAVHPATPKSNSSTGVALTVPVTPPRMSSAPASDAPSSTSKRPVLEAVADSGACATSLEGRVEFQKCGGPLVIGGGSKAGGEGAPIDTIPATIPSADSIHIDVEAWEGEHRGRCMAGNESPLLQRRRLNSHDSSASVAAAQQHAARGVAAAQQHAAGGVPMRATLTWYDTSTRKWMMNDEAGTGEKKEASDSVADSAAPQRNKIVRCDAIVQYADRDRVRCKRCRKLTKEGTLRVAFPYEEPPGSSKLRTAFLHLSCCAETPRPLQGLSASCVLGISALGPLQKREASYALGLGDGKSGSKSGCDSSRAMARAVAGGKRKELLKSLHLSPVYQALHAWREAAAKEARVGPTSLVSDKVLVHMAHAAPRTAEELEAVQGLSTFKRSIFRNGILEAVRQGRTTKLEAAKKRCREEEELRPSAAKWSAGLARQRMEAGGAPPA